MTKAAARVGLKLEWVAIHGTPDSALGARSVDLWPGIAPTPERLQRYYFSRPWLTNNYVMVYTANARRNPDWRGQRITYRKGHVLGGLARKLYPLAQLEEFVLREDALRSVCAGAADATFVEARFLDSALLQRPPGCEAAKLQVDVVPGASNDLRIAAQPEAREVADLLRDGIDKLASDGELGRILETWSLFSSVDARSLYQLQKARQQNFVLTLGSVVGTGLLVLLAWQMLRVRSAERRAREAQERAERANRAKSDFLANMSHEIRTPLNGVLGLTRLLLDRPLSESSRPDFETVHNSASGLLSILNDVLDLSKMEAGQLAIDSEPFSLRKLVEATVQLFTPQLRNRQIALAAEYPSDLPDYVCGDENRVRQILLNYLGNAAKFTQAGSVHVRLGWGSPTEQGWRQIRIEVVDTGLGIRPDAHDRIFEKFSQADASTTRQFGGTGLGLAITRHLAELMGGSVGFESELGKGSTFWVELPLEPVALPVAVSAPVIPAEKVQLSGSVLVAEDNRVNQRLISQLLENFGVDYKLVEDGAAAVEAALAQPFGVILMDCQMPVMDGFQAAREIRRRESGRRTPILAITAQAFASDEAHCYAAGMDGYLSKPIDAGKLSARLADFLPTAPSLPSA